MAATQTDLDALNEAIQTGALTVTYSTPGGSSRSVTYRSLWELKQIRREMQLELGIAPNRSLKTRSKFGRGLG